MVATLTSIHYFLICIYKSDWINMQHTLRTHFCPFSTSVYMCTAPPPTIPFPLPSYVEHQLGPSELLKGILTLNVFFMFLCDCVL